MEELLLLLPPNTAHNYINESSYNFYLLNKIQQENRLSQYIQENLILTENTSITMKTRKLNALYEAKISDTIKSKWQKFINFIKNLYGRFMANMTKIILNEQSYLNKYKDIILKKAGKSDINISYYGNYTEGIKRITTVKLDEFDWNKYQEPLSKEGYTDIVNLMLSKYKFEFNDGDDLAAQLKEFFVGGEDGQQEMTMDKFNLRQAYDYCYNYKKIKQKTDADIRVMENATIKIQSAIATAMRDASTNTTTNTTTSTTDNNPKPTENNNSDNTGETPKEESVMDMGLYRYLTEDGAPASGGTEEPKEKPSSGGSAKITVSNDVSKSSGSYNKNNDKEANDAVVKDATGSGKKIGDIDTIINKYITVCRSIITAKWTAAEQIGRDFMKIINAHVKSYAGKKDTGSNKSAGQATKFGEEEDATNNNNSGKTTTQGQSENNNTGNREIES